MQEDPHIYTVKLVFLLFKEFVVCLLCTRSIKGKTFEFRTTVILYSAT